MINQDLYCDSCQHEIETELSPVQETIPDIMWQFKTKPWDHQMKALNFAYNKLRTILAVAMGGGKTKIAIDLIVNRGHKKILIVCPKKVIEVWPDEIIKHAPDNTNFHVVCLDQEGVEKKIIKLNQALSFHEHLKTMNLVVIINYESARLGDMADALLDAKFNLIIADECHKLKTPSSSTTKFFIKLAKQKAHMLGLTGTLMADKPFDIYAQFKVFDDSIFGTNFTNFKMRYALWDITSKFPRVLKYINQDEMMQKARKIAYFVENDVLDLPEKVDIIYRCDLSPAARLIYKKLDKEFYAELKDSEITIKNAGAKLTKLLQITSGFVNDDDKHAQDIDFSKRELLKDVLQDFDLREPLVIFCLYTHNIAAVKKIVVESGRSVSELSGKSNQLKEWQDGKSDVIVVQIQCGGAGISLVRAKYNIDYSVGHALVDFEQSRARTRRPGQQSDTVTYIHLIARGTVEERVYKALSNKRNAIDYMKELVLNGQRIGELENE